MKSIVSGFVAYIEIRIGLPVREDDMKGRKRVSRFLCKRWTSESFEVLVDETSDFTEDVDDSLVAMLAVSKPSSRICSANARASASSFISSGFGGKCMEAMISSILGSFLRLPDTAFAAPSTATRGSAANTVDQ